MTHPLCYPMFVVDERSLGAEYAGRVFVWDIDKTYLATRFSSAKYLARIPMEFAVDKQAVPGMVQVLQGIRRGTGPVYASAPLYFVSASPPQLRGVLQNKMLLDGVEYDGMTFKDWAGSFRQLRPGRLRDHVGFKLCALLEGKSRRPLAEEYLFGDDVESDADAYSLYARTLAGELVGEQLVQRLMDFGVARDDAECAASLRSELPERLGQVQGIFIHQVRGVDAQVLQQRHATLVPVLDAFQLALVLFVRGIVDQRTVKETSDVLQADAVFGQREWNRRLQDALDRGLVTREQLERLGEL